MTRLSFGTLLATSAMFAWGAIFWMSPLPYSFFGKTSDAVATGKALLEHFPASGTYLIPGLQDDQSKFAQLYKTGPIGMVHLEREGDEAMSLKTFAQGFLQELVVVMLIGALLTMASTSLRTYVARVRFVTIAGMATAVFGSLGMPIWWHLPWPFHLVSAVYDVTAWFVAGLVLAAFFKPPPPPSAEAALAA